MKKNKGFTLIELLVVIAIIGILASVVLAALSSARNKGSDAAVKADLSNARAQGELFYNDNGNKYMGTAASADDVCSILAVSPQGIYNLVNGANLAYGNATATIQANATAGAWNKGTCHSGATAWAAEVPLKASVSGTPAMWCIDSTGFSGQKSTNIGSNVTNC